MIATSFTRFGLVSWIFLFNGTWETPWTVGFKYQSPGSSEERVYCIRTSCIGRPCTPEQCQVFFPVVRGGNGIFLTNNAWSWGGAWMGKYSEIHYEPLEVIKVSYKVEVRGVIWHIFLMSSYSHLSPLPSLLSYPLALKFYHSYLCSWTKRQGHIVF